MKSIIDEQFGEIQIRRSSASTHIRLRVAPDGTLRASMPLYAPIYSLKRLVQSSRQEISALLEEHKPRLELISGMQIGKSHVLIVQPQPETKVVLAKQRIVVGLTPGADINDVAVQKQLTPVIIKALRTEAKAHLPRRLAYMADAYGFTYEKIRFSHASSRWGSCSSRGTISLNIALMKLPFDLIDYVLIHELCHTRHMNHSASFWQLVGQFDPQYKLHRRVLKTHNPSAYI